MTQTSTSSFPNVSHGWQADQLRELINIYELSAGASFKCFKYKPVNLPTGLQGLLRLITATNSPPTSKHYAACKSRSQQKTHFSSHSCFGRGKTKRNAAGSEHRAHASITDQTSALKFLWGEMKCGARHQHGGHTHRVCSISNGLRLKSSLRDWNQDMSAVSGLMTGLLVSLLPWRPLLSAAAAAFRGASDSAQS